MVSLRILLATVCLLVGMADARAVVFAVNNTADLPDVLPGNGFCNVFPQAGPGPCTLRAAVIEANALAGADRIDLLADQTYTLTIAGSNEDGAFTGDLDITSDLQIIFFGSANARPLIDADGLERAFEIHEGDVTMLGFDITGGDATVASDRTGGAIAVNFDAGIVQLSLLRLYGNRANFGGALYNDGSQTSLDASELYDNVYVDFGADSIGSAIRNRGTLTVSTTSIFANSGEGALGAVAVSSEPPPVGAPVLRLINSTVASNVGAGIDSQDAASLVLRNVTVAGHDGYGVRIGGVGGTLQMRNTAIARNDTDCVISAVATLNVDRYNLDSDDTCELSDGDSNLPGIADPRLAPLARRGEFAHSSWLIKGSAMIDSAHPVIGAIGCEESDQQFNERPLDGNGDGIARCDIGAVEMSDDVIFFDPFERL